MSEQSKFMESYCTKTELAEFRLVSFTCNKCKKKTEEYVVSKYTPADVNTTTWVCETCRNRFILG